MPRLRCIINKWFLAFNLARRWTSGSNEVSGTSRRHLLRRRAFFQGAGSMHARNSDCAPRWFRYSLRHALAFSVCLGAMLAISRRSTPLELVLQVALLSCILTSYWSSSRGWRSIGRTTVIAGAVWTMAILATHLALVRSMQLYGVGVFSLLSRAFVVTIFGIATAFLSACCLFLLQVGWYGLLRTSRSLRLLCIGMSLVVLGSSGVGLYYVNTRYWRPLITNRVAALSVTPVTVKAIKERHHAPGYFRASPDACLYAELNGPTIRIFDGTTADLMTTLEAPRDSWFSAIGFLPDGETLVAVNTQQDRSASLVRWNTESWDRCQSQPLCELLNESMADQAYPILINHFLLLLHVYDRNQELSSIRISMVDLTHDELTARQFCSMTGNFNVRFRPESLLENSSRGWLVSPGSNCIIAPARTFEWSPRWVFIRGAMSPLRMEGEPMEFFEDGRLVYWERAARLVWRSPTLSAHQRPPFWNHLKLEPQYRVAILDCENGRRLARSRWWRCSMPQLIESGRSVTAKCGNSSLVWNIPFAEKSERYPMAAE